MPKGVCKSYRWAAEEVCTKYGRNVLYVCVCARQAESSDNISRRESERVRKRERDRESKRGRREREGGRVGWRGGACLGTFWAEKKWVNKFDGGRRIGVTFSALAHLWAALRDNVSNVSSTLAVSFLSHSTSNRQSLILSLYLQFNTTCNSLTLLHTLFTSTEIEKNLL